jgi:microcystin-dependent protein
LISIGARLNDIENKRTVAGKIGLSPVDAIYSGELPCDGRLLLRADAPDLFRAIQTDFNTGGESATEFRIPNLTSPSPGKLEYRISVGTAI